MERAIRIGLDSTKIVLTKACQEWFVKKYPQGMIYEYVVTEPFDLKAMGMDFVEITDTMGIPYRMPLRFGVDSSFKMYNEDKKGE